MNTMGVATFSAGAHVFIYTHIKMFYYTYIAEIYYVCISVKSAFVRTTNSSL